MKLEKEEQIWLDIWNGNTDCSREELDIKWDMVLLALFGDIVQVQAASELVMLKQLVESVIHWS
jgi:hypothetical protein